jgi:hypothetical protein
MPVSYPAAMGEIDPQWIRVRVTAAKIAYLPSMVTTSHKVDILGLTVG